MKAIIAVLLLFLPAVAAAGTGEPVHLWPAGLKLMGALVLVLGIVLLFYALSRKGFGFLPAPKTGLIKIKEMRYLMPKKALYLVEVRGEELLLAVGPERLDLIFHFARQRAGSFEENLQLHGVEE